MTRLKISLPTLSVPIGFAQVGGECLFLKSTNDPALSGEGARKGAKIAAIITLITMKPPIKAKGLLLNR